MFATSIFPLLSLDDLKPVQTAHSFVDDDFYYINNINY